MESGVSILFRSIEVNKIRFKIYNIINKKWEGGGEGERNLIMLNFLFL